MAAERLDVDDVTALASLPAVGDVVLYTDDEWAFRSLTESTVTVVTYPAMVLSVWSDGALDLNVQKRGRVEARGRVRPGPVGTALRWHPRTASASTESLVSPVRSTSCGAQTSLERDPATQAPRVWAICARKPGHEGQHAGPLQVDGGHWAW